MLYYLFSNGIVQLVTKPSSYKKEIDFGSLEHQLGFMDRVYKCLNFYSHFMKLRCNRCPRKFLHFNQDCNTLQTLLTLFTISKKRVFSANMPPDMTRGTHHFYICCSLVRSVAINEKNLPSVGNSWCDQGKLCRADGASHSISSVCWLQKWSNASDWGNNFGWCWQHWGFAYGKNKTYTSYSIKKHKWRFTILFLISKMNMHHGGLLPIYLGRWYQQGGGILSSIAHFVLPTAKKMLTETVKAAPKLIESIVNKKQSAKSAVLRGLKTAGTNTAWDTFNRIGVGRSQSYAGRKWKHSKQVTGKHSRKRHKQKDIFS